MRRLVRLEPRAENPPVTAQAIRHAAATIALLERIKAMPPDLEPPPDRRDVSRRACALAHGAGPGQTYRIAESPNTPAVG